MNKATPWYRSRHYNTVVFGLVAELGMGGTLLVWLTSPDAASRALFGPVVSEAVLIAAMAGLAVAMLVLGFAARWETGVLRICVIVVSLAVAAISVS